MRTRSLLCLIAGALPSLGLCGLSACGGDDLLNVEASEDGSTFDALAIDGARNDATIAKDASVQDSGAARDASIDAISDAFAASDGLPDDAAGDAAVDSGPPISSTYIDISAGSGSISALYPSAQIDVLNQKIVVVAWDANSPAGEPSLFRCNLDGGACSYTDLSVANSGLDAGTVTSDFRKSLALDFTNQKLLVAADQNPNYEAHLFRCNLDGSSCAYLDISAGAGFNSGENPRLIVDTLNNKLLAVAHDYTTTSQLGLYRCDLDGTGCVHIDISGDAGETGENALSVAIDPVNSKLLVVTSDFNFAYRPGLFRCDLDGTSCAHIDLSAGTALTSSSDTALAVDPQDGYLFVAVTNDGATGRPGLLRCNLDATGCIFADISAGAGDSSGQAPAIAVDSQNGVVLVATEDGTNQYAPALFRCDLNGRGCTYADISDGQGQQSGLDANILLDPSSRTALVIATNALGGDRPALYRVTY